MNFFAHSVWARASAGTVGDDGPWACPPTAVAAERTPGHGLGTRQPRAAQPARTHRMQLLFADSPVGARAPVDRYRIVGSARSICLMRIERLLDRNGGG